MRIFISAGEPSGDLHGANLIHELRRLNPSVECVGFGGDRMAAVGCWLLYPLCQIAVMWFARVLAHAPVFLSLLSKTDRFFRHEKPDAVVLIDYPGFNWWVARRAHFHGIPVFYFVPPQLWGWAGCASEENAAALGSIPCFARCPSRRIGTPSAVFRRITSAIPISTNCTQRDPVGVFLTHADKGRYDHRLAAGITHARTGTQSFQFLRA